MVKDVIMHDHLDRNIAPTRMVDSFVSRLRAFTRNMARLSTPIASFPGGTQRASVRCSAVSTNVAQFSACIALHRLSLAIPSIMVRPTALVTGRRPGTAK